MKGIARVRLLLAVCCCLTVCSDATANTYSETRSGAVAFPSSDPVLLSFPATGMPGDDGTLTLTAQGGELANNGKFLFLSIEGDSYPDIAPANFDGTPITVPIAALGGYTTDGQVDVSVVRPGFLAGGSFDLTLAYRLAVPEPASAATLLIGCFMLWPYRRN